jgi:hypothetical protein
VAVTPNKKALYLYVRLCDACEAPNALTCLCAINFAFLTLVGAMAGKEKRQLSVAQLGVQSCGLNNCAFLFFASKITTFLISESEFF